jgi:hypothetical protein
MKVRDLLTGKSSFEDVSKRSVTGMSSFEDVSKRFLNWYVFL